jgi:hypothetical protein
MLQGIQGLQGVSGSRVLGAAGRQKVKEEFLAIFYKELLKQAFQPPKLGLEGEDNSLTGSFGSDLLVERLALELARSGAFSAENLFPSGFGK